jgi:hypothetical protein
MICFHVVLVRATRPIYLNLLYLNILIASVNTRLTADHTTHEDTIRNS